jgi:spore coat polysaccharide biosynthesis protein SpsF
VRTIASVQVRMGSSRLPGKALMPIAGKPALGHLLDRLTFCKLLDGVVVATATTPENDPIAEFCAARRTPCFRGSEDDVLGRTLSALQNENANVGVEVFGDCPLIDPRIVDLMIETFVQANGAYDFVGNDLTTTYPPGMEVEVFRVSALADSAARTVDPAIREHGTLFLRQHPEWYPQLSVEAPARHRYPELELELDSPEDVPVIQAVIEHFGGRADYSLDEIIAFMSANRQLSEINAGVTRRWKAFREQSA